MAKNELGIDINDAFSGDVLIDTDTGNIIKNDSDIMSGPQEKSGTEKKDDDNLIEVDVDVTAKEDKSSTGKDNLDENSSSLPYFKVLVNALHEKGILSELDEEEIDKMEEDDTEVLFNLIKKEIDKNTKEIVDTKLKGLPKDLKALIGEGGEQAEAVPSILQVRQMAESISTITEEQIEDNEELQINLIAESLKARGYSDNRIKKRINQFKDLGDLADEAKDAITEITEKLKTDEEKLINEARIADEKAKKQEEDKLTSLKKDVFESDHIIDGISLTEQEKQRIYDSMTKVIEKDSAGNPLNEVMVTRSKNPLAFEKALHYYHSLGLFNIDKDGVFTPDLSKIKLSAKKSAVNELSDALKSEQRSSSGRPARETKMDKAKLKEQIDRMKSAFPL